MLTNPSVRLTGQKRDQPAPVAIACSARAACQTFRAASALMLKIPRPTIKSGQPDFVAAVINPATIIAIFARASFRAERNAARVRLPLCVRKRANKNAQERFTTREPNPTSVRGMAAGGTGSRNFCHAVQTVLRLGMSKIPARAIPKRARLVARQPRATAISRLIEVSSRKSTLSAKSDTEPMANATLNSTPK